MISSSADLIKAEAKLVSNDAGVDGWGRMRKSSLWVMMRVRKGEEAEFVSNDAGEEVRGSK